MARKRKVSDSKDTSIDQTKKRKVSESKEAPVVNSQKRPQSKARNNRVSVDQKGKRTKYTLDHVKLPELSTSGVVLVTGQGDVGQLGLGPDIMEKSRPALVNLETEIVDICAGGMHTVCLTKEGKVLTFGCNDEGALGREAKDDAEFTAGEVKLPGKVIQISAGDSHTAALLDDGRVYAWGTFRDSHGNMGMSSRGNEREPFEILKDQQVVKLASGDDHIVFLTNHGKLLAPAPISLKPSLKLHFDNIWTGNYCTFAKVADKADIYVFGLNNYFQIGLKKVGGVYLPEKSKEFSKYSWEQISSGQHHTIGLTTEGKVYAIGRKDYGRLGLGKDCDHAEVLTEVTGLSTKKIVNVACGSCTSFAVTSDGDLFGWGMGSNGQLGIGEEEDCDEPTHIKSKQLTDKKVFRVSSGGQHTVILASTTTVKNSAAATNGNSAGDGH